MNIWKAVGDLFPNHLFQDFLGKSFRNFRSMSGNPFRLSRFAVNPLVVAIAMPLQFATIAREESNQLRCFHIYKELLFCLNDGTKVAKKLLIAKLFYG